MRYIRFVAFLTAILSAVIACGGFSDAVPAPVNASEPFEGRWTAAFTLEENTRLGQKNIKWLDFTLELQQEGNEVSGTLQAQDTDVTGTLQGTVDDQGVFRGVMRLSWDEYDWESLMLSLSPDGASGSGTAIFKVSPDESHFYSINLLPGSSAPYASPTAVSNAILSPTPNPEGNQRVPVVWLEDEWGWLGYRETAPDWVAEFNAAHDDIELSMTLSHGGLELVDHWLALRGEGREMDWPFPDIALRSSAARYGQWDLWLDLAPYLHDYDLIIFEPAALRAWQDPSRKQFGLPIDVHSPVIFYNRELFDAAGIPYPPHRYGEPYADGEAWNIEKMESIAIQLTLDGNGRNPTQPGFNAQDIVQWGFTPQWLTLDAMAALFGTESLMDSSGTVRMPDSWREALRWYHSGIWEKHFIPNAEQAESLGGNAFSSGRVAMAYTQTWYLCCIDVGVDWDLAVLPSHQGRVTASVASDGFGILHTAAHPEAAVEALYDIVKIPEVIEGAQGIPAQRHLQAAYFSEWAQRYPRDVDWQVAMDSLIFPEFAAQPYCTHRQSSFEGRLLEFQDEISSAPMSELETGLDALVTDLQATLDARAELPANLKPFVDDIGPTGCIQQ
jgi:multiple sugar transport system substrate-binding protein